MFLQSVFYICSFKEFWNKKKKRWRNCLRVRNKEKKERKKEENNARMHTGRQEGKKRRNNSVGTPGYDFTEIEYGEVFDFSVFLEQPAVIYK